MKLTIARLLRAAADRLAPPSEGVTVPHGWTGYLVYGTNFGQTRCPNCGQWFIGSHGCTWPGTITHSGPLTTATN